MSTTLGTRLSALTAHFPLLHRHPRLLTLTALLGLSAPWLYGNYLDFLALGPGGLPYNAGGWLVALLCKLLLARETRGTAAYDREANREVYIEGVEDVPERRGERPETGWHVLPARQRGKVPPVEMGERIMEISDRLVRLNPTLVEYGPSPNERRNKGVLIARGIPTPHKAAKRASREIFHMHPSDRSLHIVLAPQDAKLVIERNWGERHGLSGTYLPLEYTWIYAPRNDEELAAVEKFMVAGIKFMTDAKVVNQ
ncbi:hypothetical protein EIP86_005793 [Pleurotus ostreatoroseus]|nr:hypothetical protein EIP86_005793 [Pleurotus ostreatoroseus]